MKARITYNITTEESAIEGCYSEHGWWMPGGYEYPLEDEDGYHEDILSNAKNGDFDLDFGDAIYYAKELNCTDISMNGKGLSITSEDAPIDRDYLEKGKVRQYTVHIDCSEGSAKRIAKLFKW
jgi:hypothetical protein